MVCCHDTACSSNTSVEALNGPAWRRALWIALIINAGFFVTEIVAGAAAGSAALQADALDFFGDAANYAISLGVAGMALAWRARAPPLKGAPSLPSRHGCGQARHGTWLTVPCPAPRPWALSEYPAALIAKQNRTVQDPSRNSLGTHWCGPPTTQVTVALKRYTASLGLLGKHEGRSLDRDIR